MKLLLSIDSRSPYREFVATPVGYRQPPPNIISTRIPHSKYSFFDSTNDSSDFALNWLDPATKNHSIYTEIFVDEIYVLFAIRSNESHPGLELFISTPKSSRVPVPTSEKSVSYPSTDLITTLHRLLQLYIPKYC